MIKILLLRHLKTEYNKSQIYMGKRFGKDILEEEIKPFSDKISQLQFPINIDSTLLISSPALRCINTLKLVKDIYNIESDITIEPDFDEMDYGVFEGKHIDEIKEKYSEVWDDFYARPGETAIPDGESLKDVQNRAFSTLQSLISNYESFSTIVICTHVDIIKSLIFKVLGLSLNQKRFLHIDNGSFSLLEFDNNELKVKFVNL